MELGTWNFAPLAIALSLLCAAGCGVQGEPLPPLLNVPQRAEIQAVQRGNRALVAWATPALTTEGQAVRPELLGPVEVYRADVPGLRAAVTPAEFEAAAQRVARLPAGSTEFAEELPANRAGNTSAYAVLLPNRRGDSAGFSNLALLAVLVAPAGPPQPRAKPVEAGVVLEWPAVAGAAAFHVYRATGDGSPEFLARAGSAGFTDQSAEFDRDYRYIIRAVAEQGAFRAESADSPAAAVHTQDVFPPAVPSNVVAIAGADPPAVDLSWEPNPEADLAGYNLYRGDGGSPPRRLNAALLVSPTYRDPDVKVGATYSYEVTSVDRKGNESARSQPVTVRVEAP